MIPTHIKLHCSLDGESQVLTSTCQAALQGQGSGHGTAKSSKTSLFLLQRSITKARKKDNHFASTGAWGSNAKVFAPALDTDHNPSYKLPTVSGYHQISPGHFKPHHQVAELQKSCREPFKYSSRGQRREMGVRAVRKGRMLQLWH